MTKMNKYFLWVCFLVISLPGYSQQSFTLEEAIRYAFANSTELKLVDQDITDAEGQILEYKSIGIPKVNGSVGYQYFINIPTQILPDFLGPAVDGRLVNYSLIDESEVLPPSAKGLPAQFGTKNNLSAGIDINTLIVDGSYFIGLKAVRMARDLVRRRRAITEQDIRRNVTDAYYSVLISEKNKEVLVNNISNLEKTYLETKAIYEGGFAEKLDVERLQLSLDNLNRNLDNVNRLINIGRNVLKFQMSFPLDQEIILADAFDLLFASIQEDQLVNEILDMENRPEFRVLSISEEVYKLNVQRYKAGYFPSLRGFASFSAALQRNKLFDKDDNNWYPSSLVGLTLDIPIFDGLDKKAKIARSKVTLEKTYLQKEALTKAVSLEVKNAKESLINAQSSLSAAEKSLQLAEKIVNTSKIKFREGVGSSLEIVQSERELYEAQANYLNAQYDLLVAHKNLKFAFGDQ